MFFSRLTSFVFFLVSLGLFASASPIANGLAVRDDSSLESRFLSAPCSMCSKIFYDDRRSQYPVPSFYPIDCGDDLVDVLTALRVSINTQVALLAGRMSPFLHPCRYSLSTEELHFFV